MMFGKSQFHMPQSVGKYYSLFQIGGYYSDLRHKKKSRIYFPITIFQYGLALYDLFLEQNDKILLTNFYNIADWAVDNIDEQGRWNSFEWSKSKSKYSSMAQGEGASLLVRAYYKSGNTLYLKTAQKALNFMITDIESGGTTKYNEDGSIVFEETSDSISILNGHIFSLWGLYDYLLIEENNTYSEMLEKAFRYIINNIDEYDNGYWSMYDLSGNIASPFYHDLHINQLKVVDKMIPTNDLQNVIEKWSRYQKSFFKRNKAFLKKVIQKLRKIKEEITLIK